MGSFWNGLGAALTGGISSLIGSAVSAADSRKAREWQSNENNIQRNWQRQMMYEQNDINVENWEREMEYNNPVNQMSRLKSAGLNPDLAYGQLSAGSSNSIAPVSQATTSPSSSAAGVVPDRQMMANSVQSALDAALKVAEAKKKRNEADNIATDTALKEIDKQFRPKKYAQELVIGENTIKVMGANLAKTQEETKAVKQSILESAKRIEMMDEQVELFKAQTANVSAQTVAQMIENNFKSATFDAEVTRVHKEIAQLDANIRLTKEQIKDYVLFRSLKILDYQADIDLKANQANVSKSQYYLNEAYRKGQDLDNRLKEIGVDTAEWQLDLLDKKGPLGNSLKDLTEFANRGSFIGQGLTLGITGLISSLLKVPSK